MVISVDISNLFCGVFHCFPMGSVLLPRNYETGVAEIISQGLEVCLEA